MKAAATTGVIGREESEVEIAKSWPSPSDWQKVVNGTLLNDAAIRDALTPVAKTVIDRTAADIQWDDFRIEVVFDRGKAEAKGRGDLPIREIELELVEGNTKDLFELARELVAHPALKLSFRSKGDRAAALKKGDLLEPRAATTPRLSPKDSVDAMFRNICEVCLLDFMANCDALAGPKPVEAVHRARFSRHAGCAPRSISLAIVSDASPSRPSCARSNGLRVSWAALRDLDVLIEHINKRDDVKGVSIDLLTERLHQRHAEALAALSDALESDRCRMFIFNFVKWLHGEKWRKKEKADQAGAKVVAVRVHKRLRRLFSLRDKLAKLPADDLHELARTPSRCATCSSSRMRCRAARRRKSAIARNSRQWRRFRSSSARSRISLSFRDLLKAQILATDGKEVKRGLARAVKDLASALKQKPRKPLGKAEAALESSDAAVAPG